MPLVSERGAILRFALRYFALVFAAGFALGVLRTVWLVPMLGERTAEIAEQPLMVALCALAASRLLRRPDAPGSRRGRAAAGGIALLAMLVVEFTVVLALRGQSLAAWYAGRDALALAAYGIALALFAALPALLPAVRSGGGRDEARDVSR